MPGVGLPGLQRRQLVVVELEALARSAVTRRSRRSSRRPATASPAPASRPAPGAARRRRGGPSPPGRGRRCRPAAPARRRCRRSGGRCGRRRRWPGRRADAPGHDRRDERDGHQRDVAIATYRSTSRLIETWSSNAAAGAVARARSPTARDGTPRQAGNPAAPRMVPPGWPGRAGRRGGINRAAPWRPPQGQGPAAAGERRRRGPGGRRARAGRAGPWWRRPRCATASCRRRGRSAAGRCRPRRARTRRRARRRPAGGSNQATGTVCVPVSSRVVTSNWPSS